MRDTDRQKHKHERHKQAGTQNMRDTNRQEHKHERHKQAETQT